MRRHTIAGYYGDEDKDSVSARTGNTLTQFNLIQNGKYGLGIGTALDDLSKKGVVPTEIATDLLVLATHVQLADTRLSRTSESQDTWTREIEIIVPVADPKKWTVVAPVLIRALNFLTGDLWSVKFRQKNKKAKNLIPDSNLTLEGVPFNSVSLFSGGLDSLIGAINKLSEDNVPFLVSHAGDGSTSVAQDACLRQLHDTYPKNRFDNLRLWMDLKGISVDGSEHETTTRGRSFLFFATGIFAGSGLEGNFTLDVPENGLIALNVPLDHLRLGSHSTRTTHPFYIARWNEFLGLLGIPALIDNPYWNKTKGEMVAECGNKVLLEKVAQHSMSCSSPTKGRWKKRPVEHCGYCLPCIIRRAAIEKGLGKGQDATSYSISDLSEKVLDSSEAEGRQIRSFQMAVARLSMKPSHAKTLLHSSGSLSDHSVAHQTELAEVYRRGLAEVNELISSVRTAPR